MAETDFTAIYPEGEQFRPAYVARQSGAGYRAPGFIGRAMSGAQPQAAPTVGAQTSGDANAALRGLYASRSSEDMGVGNSQGAISGGQQPTREAQSFSDLLASAAMGGLALTGPGGFGAYMMAQDRLPNQNGPIGWDTVRGAVNPLGAGNSVIGRAAGAAYNSVVGSGPDVGSQLGGFDPVTGMAPGERSVGIDRSVTSEPLAPPGVGAGEAAPTPGFDPVSGMAPGEGIDRSVQSSEIGPVGGGGGGAGAGSNSDPGPSTQGDPTGGMGPEHLRNGGPVGKPGSKPVPRPIVAHTGEFVQRPEAVNKYGPSAMSALNSLKAPAGAVKKATGSATKSPPPKGKMPQKGGGARDALAGLRAKG